MKSSLLISGEADCVVGEGQEEVPGGCPPNNDGVLKEIWESTYVASGAIRLIGELLNELWKGIAGNFIHVLDEETAAWSV